MPNLRVEGLHKRFGSQPALRGVTLEIHSGEYLVVAGPSGGGKTTLLRVLAGLETPDEGAVLIDGVDARRWPLASRGMALVFAQGGLLPDLTIRENLELGPRLAKATPQARRALVAEISTRLGIGSTLDRLPNEVSTGERQRAALGRALIRRPSCLLLDEPLASLDAPLRARLRDDLRALASECNLTVVHVTHDQSEALALADRLALLSDGTLRQVAPPIDAYDRPVDLWAARFLGSPAINVLPGTIERASTGLRFAPVGASFPGDRWPLVAEDACAEPPLGPAWIACRPEDAWVDPAATPGGTPWRFLRSEFNGASSEWRGDWFGQRWSLWVRGRPQTPVPTLCPLAFRPGAVRVFAGDAGGRRLPWHCVPGG